MPEPIPYIPVPAALASPMTDRGWRCAVCDTLLLVKAGPGRHPVRTAYLAARDCCQPKEDHPLV